jgi:hypothetical protein
MKTQTYKYRGYEIQVTHTPPIWQAAIYPTEPKMPAVDWTLEPIRAANFRAAEIMAQRRIDAILGEIASPA